MARVIIPNGVKRLNETFRECTALTSVVLPSSITEIGDYAFRVCPLESIAIPSSVTTIGRYAFQACRFESVIIPSSVTTIGVGAFFGCGILESIVLPDGVRYENNTFELVDSLRQVFSTKESAGNVFSSITILELHNAVLYYYSSTLKSLER